MWKQAHFTRKSLFKSLGAKFCNNLFSIFHVWKFSFHQYINTRIIVRARAVVSLLSYKDSLWFHPVRALFLSTIIAWNQRNNIWSLYDYQEMIYDPSMITESHTSICHKSFTIYVFVNFYSVCLHLVISQKTLTENSFAKLDTKWKGKSE